MATVFFITHPEVAVDPSVPVPRWRLSARGAERMRAFAAGPVPRGVGAVWASDEVKAVEAAGILAARLGLATRVHPGLRENDRASTGFLPPAEFERTADAFFAAPTANVRGWERAADAQARVADAAEAVLAGHGVGDLAVVAHGGVGTLLLCRFLGVPITRAEDQPSQGHFWAFDSGTRRVLHRWRPIAPL